MKFFGYDIKNQKIVEDFEAGIVNAIGSMFVYSLIISILFVWYHYSRPGKKASRNNARVADEEPKPYAPNAVQ